MIFLNKPIQLIQSHALRTPPCQFVILNIADMRNYRDMNWFVYLNRLFSFMRISRFNFLAQVNCFPVERRTAVD